MWLANLWNHERHAWIQEEEKNCNFNLEKWKRFSAMLLTFLMLSQVNCIFLTYLSEFQRISPQFRIFRQSSLPCSPPFLWSSFIVFLHGANLFLLQKFPNHYQLAVDNPQRLSGKENSPCKHLFCHSLADFFLVLSQDSL